MPVDQTVVEEPVHARKSNVRDRALVMCLSDPASDPRPRRMIKFLNEQGLAVDVLSYTPSKVFAAFDHFPLPSPPASFAARAVKRLLYLGAAAASTLTGRGDIFDAWLGVHSGWRPIRDQLAGREYRMIIVEDLTLLVLAQSIRGGADIVFDAREYYPRQNEEGLLFRLIEKPVRTRLCAEHLANCRVMLTVSPGLATEYAREFAVSPEVVLSAPNHYNGQPRPTARDKIRMVHHGAANRNRRLGDMIEVVRRLDGRFELDLYLTGSQQTIEGLKRQAADCPRIRFMEPVAYDAIIPMLTNYDIGLFFNIPTTFNLLNALPNKLFEFIQARLLVAIGPSPDMKHYVDAYGCGVVAADATVESMVAALSVLTPEAIDRAKARSHAAAKELCFEAESLKLQTLLSPILQSS